MPDHYSLYTWAMDRQQELQREAQRRRLSGQGREARRGLAHLASAMARVVPLPTGRINPPLPVSGDRRHDKSA